VLRAKIFFAKSSESRGKRIFFLFAKIFLVAARRVGRVPVFIEMSEIGVEIAGYDAVLLFVLHRRR